MLTQLLALVVLAGLTAATLLVCLTKWGVLAAWEVRRPAWLMKHCDFCAGYWLSALLLLAVGAAGIWWLGLAWYWLPAVLAAALATALPAAAVCRAVAGDLG